MSKHHREKSQKKHHRDECVLEDFEGDLCTICYMQRCCCRCDSSTEATKTSEVSG
jgi:hypothetical protein